MLVIKTDPGVDTKWLRYILDEFKKVNLADFDIVVDNSDNSVSGNVLYYSKTKDLADSIFYSDRPLPDGNIKYLSSFLYVIDGTVSDGFLIGYDLLWNAFVFLTRYEEFLTENNGKLIRSYSSNHPRKDKNSFKIPIVNVLFNEFEKIISGRFPELKFEKPQLPCIDFSHDVDYIKKTAQLRIKQSMFNSCNLLRSVKNINSVPKNILKTVKFALSSPSYWCFDYWHELEKKKNVCSTFYVYADVCRKNFKTWLIDPSYNLCTNLKLQSKLKELKDEGHEIGLHGSFNSALSYDKLREEKEILQDVLGFEITRTRQHWLNYIEAITPYSHEKLFRIDSTLGWNDICGFRSGTACRYRPYDHVNNRVFSYEILPQIIMDSNIFDYSKNPDVFSDSMRMLKDAKKITKKFNASVSWHQRVCSSDYNWQYFYEEILNDL